MKISTVVSWVREKAVWLAVGAVALGALFGEIHTEIGTKAVQDVMKWWDTPALSSAGDVIQEVRACSVNIRCSHVQAPNGSGSGTILHRFGHTYVLTAHHVIECELNQGATRDGRVWMTAYQGTNEWEAYVVSSNKAHDLAILRIEELGLHGRSARLLDPDIRLYIGTKILHVGNLHGTWRNSYSEGVLANVNVPAPGDDSTYYDQTTTGAYPGSSGGGMFTADGRYVGMLVRGIGPQLNHFIPVRRMWEWADDDNLLWIFLCD